MVEVKMGCRRVTVPFCVRFHGVTEKRFDELVDEDTRAELLDGVMVVPSPASLQHDNVAGFLRWLFRGFAEGQGLGLVLGPDALVHLATCRRFGPDWFFLKQRRVSLPFETEQFEGAPDLIGEVLSPSTRDFDLEDKRPAFQEAGVSELWFVDLEEQKVMVDRRRGNRYVTRTVHAGKVASTVLKGFWIEASWLWQDQLPNIIACLREILPSSREK